MLLITTNDANEDIVDELIILIVDELIILIVLVSFITLLVFATKLIMILILIQTKQVHNTTYK
jgi:hypothetical protein